MQNVCLPLFLCNIAKNCTKIGLLLSNLHICKIKSRFSNKQLFEGLPMVEFWKYFLCVLKIILSQKHILRFLKNETSFSKGGVHDFWKFLYSPLWKIFDFKGPKSYEGKTLKKKEKIPIFLFTKSTQTKIPKSEQNWVAKGLIKQITC